MYPESGHHYRFDTEPRYFNIIQDLGCALRKVFAHCSILLVSLFHLVFLFISGPNILSLGKLSMCLPEVVPCAPPFITETVFRALSLLLVFQHVFFFGL